MNTQEKIKVMQALLDGETIEYRYRTPDGYSKWSITGDPIWNWQDCEYRIKTQQIRPYDSAYELLKDAIKHDFLCMKKGYSSFYGLTINSANLVTLIHDGNPTVSITYQKFLADYTWEDGSWCGAVVDG